MRWPWYEKSLALIAALLFGVAIFGVSQSINAQPRVSTLTSAGVGCNGAAQYDQAIAGATNVISATATGESIYICGFTIWAAGTTNVNLEFGTGATCGTGETVITPAFRLTAQTGIQDTSPFFRGLHVPVGQHLCLKSSAAQPVQAVIYFAQF